jgi:hypothetical protein
LSRAAIELSRDRIQRRLVEPTQVAAPREVLAEQGRLVTDRSEMDKAVAATG